MRLVRVGLMATALALIAVVGACSDNKSTADTTSESSGGRPEDQRAPDAEVATGLKKIESTVNEVAKTTGSDKDKAKELTEEIEPVWEEIEGTIKAHDQDAYITFEDNFATLESAAEDGDAAKAQQAATTVSGAVTAYLAKYPG
jgi:hypothetical protein